MGLQRHFLVTASVHFQLPSKHVFYKPWTTCHDLRWGGWGANDRISWTLSGRQLTSFSGHMMMLNCRPDQLQQPHMMGSLLSSAALLTPEEQSDSGLLRPHDLLPFLQTPILVLCLLLFFYDWTRAMAEGHGLMSPRGWKKLHAITMVNIMNPAYTKFGKTKKQAIWYFNTCFFTLLLIRQWMQDPNGFGLRIE